MYNPRMLRAGKVTAGPVGTGTRFASAAKSMGRVTDMVIELTDYDQAGLRPADVGQGAHHGHGIDQPPDPPTGEVSHGQHRPAPRRCPAQRPGPPLPYGDGYDNGRYLVSMLGEDTNWVRNVRASGGHAVLRHGDRERVTLQEVEAGGRAPILRCYLQRAPGARAHIPVDRRAPVEAFEPIAAQYPVFRVTAADESVRG